MSFPVSMISNRVLVTDSQSSAPSNLLEEAITWTSEKARQRSKDLREFPLHLGDGRNVGRAAGEAIARVVAIIAIILSVPVLVVFANALQLHAASRNLPGLVAGLRHMNRMFRIAALCRQGLLIVSKDVETRLAAPMKVITSLSAALRLVASTPASPRHIIVLDGFYIEDAPLYIDIPGLVIDFCPFVTIFVRPPRGRTTASHSEASNRRSGGPHIPSLQHDSRRRGLALRRRSCDCHDRHDVDEEDGAPALVIAATPVALRGLRLIVSKRCSRRWLRLPAKSRLVVGLTASPAATAGIEDPLGEVLTPTSPLLEPHANRDTIQLSDVVVVTPLRQHKCTKLTRILSFVPEFIYRMVRTLAPSIAAAKAAAMVGVQLPDDVPAEVASVLHGDHAIISWG